MSNINDSISGLEFAQIGWVVPDIRTAVKFLSNALGIAGFPQPEQIRAQDLDMTYYGKVVPGEWLTSEVDHPIARMAFFDTYQTLGVVTEIVGITPEGWSAIKQMQKAR